MGYTCKQRMGKLHSDYLTDLIHSLTANEKRYFKLSGLARGSSNHKILFDALDSTGANDLAALKKKLKGSRMNLAYERRYLQQMLLRSLRNFHEGSSVEAELHQALLDIEIVFNKEQYELCHILIKQAMATAVKTELYLYQLHLIRWKRSCLVRMGKSAEQARFLKEEPTLQQQCLDQLNNLQVYKVLHHRAYYLIGKQGSALSATDKQTLKELLDGPHMQHISQATSVNAKAHFLQIKIWCHHILAEVETAYKYSRQLIQLLENNRHYMKVHPQVYLATLATHYNRCYALDYIKEASEMLKQAEDMLKFKKPALSEGLKTEVFYFVSERYLMQYAYDNRFKEALQQAEKNRDFYTRKKLTLRPSYHIIQHYFTALSHFHLGQYEQAVKHVRIILDEIDNNVRIDFILFTHVLNVMIHYELGNYQLVPYLSKSLNRFMKVRQLQRKSVTLIIKLLTQFIKHRHDKRACVDALRNFKKDIQAAETTPHETILTGTLQLDYWINSKKNQLGTKV